MPRVRQRLFWVEAWEGVPKGVSYADRREGHAMGDGSVR
jgi:hypothetical protein